MNMVRRLETSSPEGHRFPNSNLTNLKGMN